MSLTIVVTDGEQRAALAAVRSLGRAGHSVHVCSAQANSIAGASRYCASAATVSDPLTRPHTFVEDLLRLIGERHTDVVLPVTEASLLAILPHRDRFSAAIPFATAEAFQRICDKRLVLDAARRYGISVPMQTEILRPENGDLLHDAPYPLVLKPHRSVSGHDGERVRASVRYACDPREAKETLRQIPASAFPVLAQQRIDGPGFGISLLMWGGELRAAFAHRRIREKPPSGGVSVLRESIPLDNELLRRSVDLLRAFGWQGVAMVEFKTDQETNRPYLMEINGRLWGSLQLAIDAGVDFPRLLVESSLGFVSPPVLSYAVGVRSRWEWGDVDHLLASMIHSKSRLALPRGVPRHRLRTLGAFLRAFRSDNVPEIFHRDDPRPFFRETANWFRGR